MDCSNKYVRNMEGVYLIFSYQCYTLPVSRCIMANLLSLEGEQNRCIHYSCSSRSELASLSIIYTLRVRHDSKDRHCENGIAGNKAKKKVCILFMEKT